MATQRSKSVDASTPARERGTARASRRPRPEPQRNDESSRRPRPEPQRFAFDLDEIISVRLVVLDERGAGRQGIAAHGVVVPVPKPRLRVEFEVMPGEE